MRITLKRNWFGPDGVRRRERDNPHEVPNDWKDKLPAGAKVLDEPEVKAPKETEAEKKKREEAEAAAKKEAEEEAKEEAEAKAKVEASKKPSL